ncbi:MAG: flagellar hook-basal body complex protein FliE [Pseudomonadales bacterium]|nr:flagellar hook-basal body complex protein FliE [Pseudomonadales bacterium]
MSVDMEMTRLLADMQTMRAQVLGPEVSQSNGIDGVNKIGGLNKSEGPDFSNMLKDAINKVNDVQKESGELKTSFLQGDSAVDLAQVMIASQKATVAFQAMTQVRNKLVDAYKDVMNMPV